MTDFEKRLCTYKPEAYSPDAVHNTASCVSRQLAEMRKNERSAVSYTEFIFNQMTFVTKKMWVLQGAILVFAYAAVMLLTRENGLRQQIFPLLSVLAPVLILINITDFVRVYNSGSLELELAAKFSLQKAAAAKLIIFGVSDAAVIAAFCVFAAVNTKAGAMLLLLYILVPFNLMCCGCMFLMRTVSADSFAFASASLACCIYAAIFVLNINAALYTGAHTVMWIAAFAVTAVPSCVQVYKVLKTRFADMDTLRGAYV